MNGNPYNPDYEYLAYIDESGETGLRNVLGIDGKGSSEWFVLSLLLVPRSEEPNIAEWVRDMILNTGSRQLTDLHFARLPDGYKDTVTKSLAEKPVKGFVICSNKKNMRRYRNVRAERMGVMDQTAELERQSLSRVGRR